jgi:aspartokinase/homoserine dehydrogenase 1
LRVTFFLYYEGGASKTLKTADKDSRELIKTNSNFGKATVNLLTNQLITDFFSNESQVVIMPGFISSSSDGINTTLGRGGSDYTAAIMAGAMLPI